jgi:hypothetical protein
LHEFAPLVRLFERSLSELVIFAPISRRSGFASELKRPSAAGIQRWDKQQKLAFGAAFRAV